MDVLPYGERMAFSRATSRHGLAVTGESAKLHAAVKLGLTRIGPIRECPADQIRKYFRTALVIGVVREWSRDGRYVSLTALGEAPYARFMHRAIWISRSVPLPHTPIPTANKRRWESKRIQQLFVRHQCRVVLSAIISP